MCVHLDGLNAEHQFRVWVTILDNTSLFFLFFYYYLIKGSVFQSFGAETEKDLSPFVFKRDFRTFNNSWTEDLSDL